MLIILTLPLHLKNSSLSIFISKSPYECVLCVFTWKVSRYLLIFVTVSFISFTVGYIAILYAVSDNCSICSPCRLDIEAVSSFC